MPPTRRSTPSWRAGAATTTAPPATTGRTTTRSARATSWRRSSGWRPTGERRQPVGLQPEERLQEVARADLVVVRPVVAGGAVVVAAPALHDGVERRVGGMARAHEHQVLE